MPVDDGLYVYDLAVEFLRVDDGAASFKPADPPHHVAVQWCRALDDFGRATRDVTSIPWEQGPGISYYRTMRRAAEWVVANEGRFILRDGAVAAS